MEEDKRTERRRLQNRESQRRYRNRRTSRTEFTIKPTAVLHDALSVHKGSDSLMGPVEFYRLGQAVHEPGEQTDLHVGSESESLHHGSADVALASDASFQFVPSTQDIYGAWPSPSPNNLEFASANPNEEACRQYLCSPSLSSSIHQPIGVHDHVDTMYQHPSGQKAANIAVNRQQQWTPPKVHSSSQNSSPQSISLPPLQETRLTKDGHSNRETAKFSKYSQPARNENVPFFEDYLEYMVARFQSISGPSYRISGHNDNDSGSGEDEEDSGIDS
ncbi:hypothetical protein SCAR479_10926 [Seiridium cardinale]|uniref:BZIP domain-containing protein n=1 Tax=Seiridium cardinale TaxID=138064 RepID=A0ABR2XF14_9PEZI